MIEILVSIFSLFSIVLVATLCGLGMLVVIGLTSYQYRILLAPCTALSASGIIVALVVTSGTPVGEATPLIWVFWGLSGIYGTLHLKSAVKDLGHVGLLCVSVLLTCLLSGGFISFGLTDYLGSTALDGWSYVSFGEYLRQYPKGTEGNLAPLYQYAAHLSGTRFVASAMLAVLIPPWLDGIDTQMTVGPLLIVSIFSFAFAVTYASLVVKHRGLNLPVWLAVSVGLIGGWLPQAMHMHNYDNLLALPLAPTLFALNSDQRLKPLRKVLLSAVLVAGCIYIYPELSPLLMFGYFVAVFDQGYFAPAKREDGASFSMIFAQYIMVIGLTCLLAYPYLEDALRYFGQQLSATVQLGGRPGEGAIPALLDIKQIWGALWGLEGRNYGHFVGGALTLTALVGLCAVIRKKYLSFSIYVIVICALFVIMVAQKHYDYGAYKILLIGWWAFAIVFAVGVSVLLDPSSRFKARYRATIAGLMIVVLGFAMLVWVTRLQNLRDGYNYKSVKQFLELRDIVAQLDGGVQVAIANPTVNAWLVYEFRDLDVLFSSYSGYMVQSHVRPLMTRSHESDKTKIRYILADVLSLIDGEVVWRDSSKKLVRADYDSDISNMVVRAPNGNELVGGLPFFWIGSDSASLNVETALQKKLRVELVASVGGSVGSLTQHPPRLVVAKDGKTLFVFELDSTESHIFHVVLSPGDNRIVLRADYDGKVTPNNNGDPRTLIIGVKLLSVDVRSND